MAGRARLSPAMARFLSRHRVAHLATADPSGLPHAVPICFAVRRQTLYSILDLKPKRVAPHRLRRVRNLVDNPRVAVVIDRYREDWSRLAFVLLEGRARLLHRGTEHAAALRLLRWKYAQYRRMDLRGRPVVAIRVRRATAWGRLGG
jgi:coenzyme F420-0:L-glutamate ligase/coenzyme F420-1:gamma-L-glutamate ligase